MPIVDNDLYLIKSEIQADIDANGGGMLNAAVATASVVSGAPANLFQSAGLDERTAGSVKYRKAFFKVHTDGVEEIPSLKMFLDIQTPATDAIFWLLGADLTTPPDNFADTQDDILNSSVGPIASVIMGSGKLNADVNPGDSVLVVDCENAAYPIFRDGMMIRISDIVLGVGVEEYATIDTVNFVGPQATINLTAPLTNGFGFADARVMGVIETELAAGKDNLVVDSVGGGFDLADLVLNNQGTIFQHWTLTKLTAPDMWNISGHLLGSLGDVDITANSELAPINPAFGKIYFQLLEVDLSGSGFADGDTISFTTTPCAVPLWFVRAIPAGTATASDNLARMSFVAETLS